MMFAAVEETRGSGGALLASLDEIRLCFIALTDSKTSINVSFVCHGGTAHLECEAMNSTTHANDVEMTKVMVIEV